MSTFFFSFNSNSLFSIDCSNNGSKPKGGGLSSTIGGSQMLVEFKTTDFRKHLDIGYILIALYIIKFKFHGNIKRYGF
jgi:hypothetical protein